MIRFHHYTCSPEAPWHFTSNFNSQCHLGVIDAEFFLSLAPSSSSLKFHSPLGICWCRLVLAKMEWIPIYPLGLSQIIHSQKQSYFGFHIMSFTSDFYFIFNKEYANLSERSLIICWVFSHSSGIVRLTWCQIHFVEK